MNAKFNKKIMASLTSVLLLSLSAMASADDTTSGSTSSTTGVTQGTGGNHKWRHKHWEQGKEVRQACAAANGFTLPPKGQRLDPADKTALQACVQTFKQNLQTCTQNAGLSKPQPGEKPSAENIAAFKQCRTTALSEITKNSTSSN